MFFCDPGPESCEGPSCSRLWIAVAEENSDSRDLSIPCRPNPMDPLNEICAHVDEVPARGLTVEKIWDRGHVLDVTEDAIEFEVERHTSASGAMYREGLAMSAFVTYWPRYRYDRATHELTELEERRPRDFECDYDLLADEILQYGFDLRVYARDDAWVCEEVASNREATVEDEEDVQAFVEQMVRNWDLEIYGMNLEDVLDDEELEAHFSRLEDALVAEAQRQARKAWERRDEL